MKRRMIQLLIVIVALAATSWVTAQAVESVNECKTTDAFCFEPIIAKKFDGVRNLAEPKVAVPSWLGVQP